MDVKKFKKLPIMGIIRGTREDAIEPLTESVISAGLKTMEITMNTEGAPRLIKKMVKVSDKRLFVGAGTVLNEKELKQALDSGATFIVMPTLVKEVMDYCVRGKIPVFPGAFTPQEIYNAASRGATMVKVFPAKFFGPDYIKEIKGPFQDIELLACGGVNPGNIGSFFSAGASAVAFGGSIFKKEWLSAKKFRLIEGAVKRLIESYIGYAG
ncbi:MAG: bifunctional 4-hydroxy-2-oxoglutarate aldolase/2-dehydro-3-deoxy-phosphogluconate aldolase [Candidatus Omnitrophica bacterium]|nr:bifunctional 4-hydroxy-2-oxoglutarate aldolase/2-dehydro-3-deoxy-phosphogluconate aldolase [Candidatus Omnitrophota bacterium]